MAIETDIMDSLVSRIQSVPEIVTVNSDRVFLAISDFQDHEIPAVQIWDVAQSITHQRHRILVNWAMSVEIITRSTTAVVANQRLLWELRRKIQLAIWEGGNLGVRGVVHLIYTGNFTDLHLLAPNYISRIDFDVQFYDELTGSC